RLPLAGAAGLSGYRRRRFSCRARSRPPALPPSAVTAGISRKGRDPPARHCAGILRSCPEHGLPAHARRRRRPHGASAPGVRDSQAGRRASARSLPRGLAEGFLVGGGLRLGAPRSTGRLHSAQDTDRGRADPLGADAGAAAQGPGTGGAGRRTCRGRICRDRSGGGKRGGVRQFRGSHLPETRTMMHAFLFTVLCLSWGSTWIAIKVGVDLVPPFFLAGTRFL